MRTCDNCGRSIEQKHVNARFCSNKGRGNCKDKFHNREDEDRNKRMRERLGIPQREYHPLYGYDDPAFYEDQGWNHD